jgi:hypothetical protein
MRWLILATLVVLTVGCGSLTDIEGSWANPEYASKPLHKLAVFCVGAKSFISAATIEGAMVKNLEANGISATSAASIAPNKSFDADNDGKVDAQHSKEALAAKLRELGFDGVLVIAVKDMKSEERYVEGTTTYQPAAYYGYNGWHNYWSTSYQTVQTPGYTTTDVTAYAEANLYALDKDALAWGAQTATFNPQSLQGAADSFASAIVPAMTKAGVIKAPSQP